jgi:cytochrome c5
MRGTLWSVGLFVAALCSAEAQQPMPLPAGDGADIVRVACTQCHGPSAFAQLREGPDGWRRQVYDMILRGAQLQPADIDVVVAYLASHYGIGNYVSAGAPASTVHLPDGAGKDLVEQRCTLCHGLDRVAGTPRTRSEWDAIVAGMLLIGAPISESDARTITAFLEDNVAL